LHRDNAVRRKLPVTSWHGMWGATSRGLKVKGSGISHYITRTSREHLRM
jgi:hypothetical protein